MQTGLNQWCFPEGTPLEDVFLWTKEAGMGVVELNVGEPGGVGLTMETTAEEATAIKRLADRYAIQLRSLSTALLWKTPLSANDGNLREEGKEVVRKMLALADVMEMETILVVPGVVTKDVSYRDCYERSQTALRELAPYAERSNTSIGVENVWNRFLLSPLEMAAFIDGCESPFVGAYFDVGNVLQFGYPEQWIEILNERILKVHVKDFKTSTGNITGFTNLLSGDVDWKKVANALREIGYDSTIVAELSPYDTSAKALAIDTAHHMDVIFGQ
ncbi:sugar phosphate isomerase/epimerase family protein [Geomicrobium sp. JSM 1781026]|uniref:sugar phosphate isomerase/epimerase family protein n=1 Tax=Geomicrobium sp. JSM 1781026 TaxID=3344580 RepID=UPI0035C0D933